MKTEKQLWRVALLLFVIAAVFYAIDSFTCLFVLWGPEPYFCYNGPYALTRLLGLGFYLLGPIIWLFSPQDGTQAPSLILSSVFEIAYVFLLAHLYMNREKVKNMFSSTSLFFLTFLYVYIAFIFIYNIPYDLMASFGLGNYVIGSSVNNAEFGFDPVTNALYTLIWPAAGFFRADTDAFFGVRVLFTSLIGLITVTSAIYFFLFLRNNRK